MKSTFALLASNVSASIIDTTTHGDLAVTLLPDILNLANLIGWVAAVITVCTLIRKDNRGLLLMMGVGVTLWSVHYAMLGSISGSVIHAVAAVSIFGANATANRPLFTRVTLGVMFSALGISAAAYYGTGWADVIAATGCVLMTITQYTGRGASLRLGFLGGESLFFVFAVMVGSVPGAAVTLANAAAGMIGLIRMRATAPTRSSTKSMLGPRDSNAQNRLFRLNRSIR